MKETNAESVLAVLKRGEEKPYAEMVNYLLEKGYSLFDIAAAALQLHFSEKEIKIADIRQERKQYGKKADVDFSKIVMDIGRSSHAAPNHIVASITERSLLHGSDIGKIEIYDDYSVISIPSGAMEDVLDRMYGAKICGKPVKIRAYEEKGRTTHHPAAAKKHPSGHRETTGFHHERRPAGQKHSGKSYGKNIRRKG